MPIVSPDEGLLFLLQAGVLLVAALLLGRLAVRIGLPAIVGELAVGVLLGPTVFGLVLPDVSEWLLPQGSGASALDGVAELGVLLLVGVTGAGIDLALLARRRAVAVWIGLPALIVPLGLGIAAGLLLPAVLLPTGADRGTTAMFIGVAMGISALPVTAKILLDMKLFHRNIGQLTLIAAALNDAVGWLLLSLVSVVATTGWSGGSAVALAFPAAFVLVAWFAGRPLVGWAMRAATRTGDTATAVAIAVVVILVAALAAETLGLDATFGAFAGGVLLGSAGQDALTALGPLRTVTLAVLAPLFFATAGLRVDLTTLASPLVLAVGGGLLLVAIVGKFAGAYVGARLGRLGFWEAVAVGAGMNARGVVEVVIATIGLELGVLSVELYTIIILIAIVTSVMAPPILRFAMARIEGTPEEEIRAVRLGWTTDKSAVEP